MSYALGIIECMLQWAAGLLTSLHGEHHWSIGLASAKTGKSSIFWLSSSLTLSHASMINGWNYYNHSNTKIKQHKSPGSALTTYHYCRTQTILQWFSSALMLKYMSSKILDVFYHVGFNARSCLCVFWSRTSVDVKHFIYMFLVQTKFW